MEHKAKYTKEQWIADGNIVYALEHNGWRNGEEQFRNRFYAQAQGYRDTPKEELEANARLMASAHELLEALQDVVKWCSDERFYQEGLTRLQAKTLFNGIVKEVSPAIAKALGE